MFDAVRFEMTVPVAFAAVSDPVAAHRRRRRMDSLSELRIGDRSQFEVAPPRFARAR